MSILCIQEFCHCHHQTALNIVRIPTAGPAPLAHCFLTGSVVGICWAIRDTRGFWSRLSSHFLFCLIFCFATFTSHFKSIISRPTVFALVLAHLMIFLFSVSASFVAIFVIPTRAIVTGNRNMASFYRILRRQKLAWITAYFDRWRLIYPPPLIC